MSAPKPGGEIDHGSASTAGGAPGVAIVVFGDVVHSRRAPEASSAWLRELVGILDRMYGDDQLAPFGFTQGDEIQGLLVPTADPFRGIVRAWLESGSRPMRWMVAAGGIVAGEGPATERTGEAFLAARDGIQRLSQSREGLGVTTGDRRADRLLESLAPLLPEMLGALRPRQREVARLALVEGCRQAEIAKRLRVQPATVSVIAARARVRSIDRLSQALRQILSEGVAAVAGAAPPAVS